MGRGVQSWGYQIYFNRSPSPLLDSTTTQTKPFRATHSRGALSASTKLSASHKNTPPNTMPASLMITPPLRAGNPSPHPHHPRPPRLFRAGPDPVGAIACMLACRKRRAPHAPPGRCPPKDPRLTQPSAAGPGRNPLPNRRPQIADRGLRGVWRKREKKKKRWGPGLVSVDRQRSGVVGYSYSCSDCRRWFRSGGVEVGARFIAAGW